MFSITIALIDPNDHSKNRGEFFNAVTEKRVVELANAYVNAVQKKTPLVQANFRLQKQVWKNIPFSDESMEVLTK